MVFNASIIEKFEQVSSLRNEFVVCVEGVVTPRSPETVNDKMPNGTIEIVAHELTVINQSGHLPFSLDDDAKVNEQIRLKYRYLDLRRSELQRNLKLRNEVYKSTRSYLDANGFLEVETPMLGKSTPEGARDYLVPSRTFPGSFFALPQSPQLYKQLLMLGGVDRYFQIARCFRDEDLRADRQPEFTQIDLEMSFVTKEEQVMHMVEGLVNSVYSATKQTVFPTPFATMTYEHAMNTYGSDKPDTRFDLKIVDVSDLALKSTITGFHEIVKQGGSVRVINGKNLLNRFARRDLDALGHFVKEFGAQGLSWTTVSEEGVKGSLVKFFEDSVLKELLTRLQAENNDVLLFLADANNDVVLNALGKLRLHLANMFGLIDETKTSIFWVTDFPLFEYSKEDKRYVAKHHPFTSPKDEDLEFLESQPEKVRAKAYDLIINGYEVGGGSIRIYNQELQTRMFKALGFSQESIDKQFGFFVNAFQYGTPPHGGLAIGLDRLVMLLLGISDIRSVIAFPKIQTAMDLMTLAPAEVEKSQLDTVNIAIKPILKPILNQ